MNMKKIALTALTVTVLGSTAAFAQGKGNGVENGGGASNNGNNGNGAIASELKSANAAHASAQAFLNANPNSAVGMLATMRDDAAQAASDAYEAAGVDPEDELRTPEDIQADIDALSELDRTIEAIQGDIAALDPESETYEADLAALAEELAAREAELATLALELALPEALEAAEDEALASVGLDDLSDEALIVLWDLLDK